MVMTQSSPPDPLYLFKRACKRRHLKLTPQRIRIYQELLKSKIHPSAETLFRAVRRDLPSISFDTVNRTLNTLCDMGVIHPVETHGGPRRFDGNIQAHHHFLCRNCGDIADFKSKDCDTVRIPAAVEDNCEIRTKRVVVSGRCPKCAKRKTPYP
jgi:Fur family peroxide stress response transcriptional regulator